VPSVAGDPPSLVDESSASDLLGLAVNLIGVGSESINNTSTAVTVSAYALKSALSGRDPLEPEYYNANSDWRRLSVTLGADFPEDSDNPQAERGVIAGAKYLIYNERDITKDRDFGPRVEAMLQEVGLAAVDVLEDPIVAGALDTALCVGPNGEFVDESKIDPATLEAIDEVIERKGSAAIEYQQNAADLAREVNARPQVAVEFLTNQRQDDGTSTYKAGLTADFGTGFDLGFADTLAFTFNGAFAYDDRSADDGLENGYGGTFAGKLRMFRSPTMLDRRVPWTLSVAGDGSWKTNIKPQYRAQAVVSIALWEGVELPISVTYANQTEFDDEDQVIGNFGFTVDTAKLIGRFR
jgi:hypothetical protein